MLGTSIDIKYPGLNILPPGVERHVVNGGGLTAFQIFPDDELEIINNEGNQICEIICFNKDGKSDLGILNQSVQDEFEQQQMNVSDMADSMEDDLIPDDDIKGETLTGCLVVSPCEVILGMKFKLSDS